MRLLSFLAFLSGAMPVTGAELVMVETPGCYWCARWDTEIATAYPRTPEGHMAPLRRIRLDESLPDNLDLEHPVRVTPTFLLIEDGEEIARIEGYPGEDFFWPLLGKMLEKLQKPDNG